MAHPLDRTRFEASANPDPAGFGVYVHWPFCAAKCPYCDFNSHVRHGGVDEQAFRDGLVNEIRTTAGRIGPRHVASVFFGGGTPSLMSGSTVAAVLDAIADAWQLEASAEISLEANPTSVEARRLRDFRAAGVNRVSLGVQALNDRDLKALGRLHSAEEARNAVSTAQSLFDRVSFDLIYARSNQTIDEWQAELQAALALAAGHLSLYQLTIEDGTPFADLYRSGKLKVPPSELADDFYAMTQELTAAAGLPHYETSNHARPGEECRHNLLYWRYGEYAGIGAGAHGRIIEADGSRWATAAERNPEQWLARVHEHGGSLIENERLTREEMADEVLLMGLRLAGGISLDRIKSVSGLLPNPDKMAELEEAGLLGFDTATRSLFTKPSGRFVLDRIVLELAATMQAPAAEAHSPA